MLKKINSLLILILITLIAIVLMALIGPQEQTLGSNVRLVYLHGAWVLTAEIAFLAAGIVGVIALASRKSKLYAWSRALGITGIIFWITYLPLSLWAMQANWNGLFLAEPRFRLALVFAVTGLLLQIGLWVMDIPWLTALSNVLFIIILRIVFSAAAYIMHPPPSPIFNSGNMWLISYFIVLNLLTMVAAYLVTRVILLITTKKLI